MAGLSKTSTSRVPTELSRWRKPSPRSSMRTGREAETRDTADRCCVAAEILTAWDALRFNIKRIHGLARGHEQPIPLSPAEAHIGAALRQEDAADHRAVRCEHRNAVLAFAA